MPTLSGLLDWLKKEGLNAIWIILIIFCIKFLSKTEYVKAVILLVAAGVAAFVINKPDIVVQGFEKIGSMLFGSGG